MKNIYLVGFMGVGKSLVGKALANYLKQEFLDMDEIIEKREGLKIVDIFSQKGESYFRKAEKELLKEISLKQNLVVSCGGGLICSVENLKILKNTGLVFNLKASAKVIYQRIKNERHRPLLKVEDPLKQIESLLKKREPFYLQAHYAINTEKLTVKEIVDMIVNKLKNG
ncbi:MAG: shikimate kinase [Candidatus Omnitrophica bacterium]|nr:shikimate kinase [Candidatus Omnitrophota bacterium]